jgi:hypothetical protein
MPASHAISEGITFLVKYKDAISVAVGALSIGGSVAVSAKSIFSAGASFNWRFQNRLTGTSKENRPSGRPDIFV